MTQRLIWNFEMTTPINPLDFETLSKDSIDSKRWEKRYFWPHDAVITLHNLNPNLLSLPTATIEQKQDTYCIIPNKPFNIKERRGELLFKPQLDTIDDCLGFNKKINMLEQDKESILEGLDSLSVDAALKLIAHQSVRFALEKTSIIFRFPTKPLIKMELSRIVLNQKVYFSLCVEGKSQSLVQSIASHLRIEVNSCDYVRFLQQFL